jgi:hypothetical protein
VALSALNCTRCGAPLRDEPTDGLIRCAHCGQNHAFLAPQAPPQPTPVVVVAPAHFAWKLPVIALGALVLVSVTASVMLQSRSAPSAAAGNSAGAEGPGDPSLSYKAGEAVDVYWNSSWWPGTIKTVLGEGRYRIGYDDYSASWDEDVTPRRLRRRGSTP